MVVMTSSQGNSIAFDSVEGRLYAIDVTEDLQAEAWVELVDEIEGTGAPIEWSDPDESATRFYRVRVQLDGAER